MSWEKLDAWWIEELETDPTYEAEIYPQLLRLLQPKRESVYLDLGCGTGTVMALILSNGAKAIGCDSNSKLLALASKAGPVVQSELPWLKWARDASVDGVYLGLVLEHLEDEVSLFEEAARVTRPGGVMAMVINHPIWTAPESSPIEDVHGEVLYRTGTYFGRGFTDEPAAKGKVRFYHRTTGELLTAAASAGWHLQVLEESGLSSVQLDRYPDYAGQEQIPRLMGMRWTRPGASS